MKPFVPSLQHTREFYTREKDLVILENISKMKNNIQKKTHSFLKLARYKNIPPTLLLLFTGGYLVRPSLPVLFLSSNFLVASINTILIMMNSMVLNDLFDIETDRINHPQRPLINGEITKREAQIFSLLLIFITEFLNFMFLPSRLQKIIHIGLLQILIYTPILKRIPLIKNLSCASLVSFAVYFGGLSISGPIYNGLYNYGFEIENGNELLKIATTFIFLGSFQNELLLDMRDVEGDRENGIITIPTLFGKANSWKLANMILFTNLLVNIQKIIQLNDLKTGTIFLFLFSPLFYQLREIKKKKYDKKVIRESVKNTNLPLFMVMLFLMVKGTKVPL
jgi:4-hydroxybenzoate polyprenyltransferase